jgi:TPR repeat protein
LSEPATFGDASAHQPNVMYDRWQGAPQDADKATEMFTRAAAQGNTAAQCNLASMYFHGIGVERNFEQALTLYAMAEIAQRANTLLGFQSYRFSTDFR